MIENGQLVQKLAFLAIFPIPNRTKSVPMAQLGPADSVGKKDYLKRTVGSEVSIFGHFHHTKPVQMA